MHRIRLLVLPVFALSLLAGCGGEQRHHRLEHRRDGASDCTPAQARHPRPRACSPSPPTSRPTRPTSKNNDPTNGKGFESAVAYAIGRPARLSAEAKVKWTVEPFNSSYAPGPKDFDFDVNQISITPVRAKAGRLLGPLLHRQPGGGRAEGLRRRQGDLDRRPQGHDDRRPDRHHQPRRRQRSDRAERAAEGLRQLQRRRHGAQERTGRRGRRRRADRALPDRGAGAGRRRSSASSRAPGGDRWGALLAKDSPLTACVSQAIEELRGLGRAGSRSTSAG